MQGHGIYESLWHRAHATRKKLEGEGHGHARVRRGYARKKTVPMGQVHRSVREGAGLGRQIERGRKGGRAKARGRWAGCGLGLCGEELRGRERPGWMGPRGKKQAIGPREQAG